MPIEPTSDGEAEVWWGETPGYAPLAVDLEPGRPYVDSSQYGQWWFYLTLGYTSAQGTRRVLAFAELLESEAVHPAEFSVEWADERDRRIAFRILPDKALALATKLREVIAYYGWRPPIMRRAEGE